MRPIKFRTYAGTAMRPCGIVNNISHAVVAVGCDFEEMTFNGYMININEPVMQFTGRLDIHDKEIFESDIVRGICSSNAAHVCEGLQQSGMMGKEVTGIVEYSNLYAQFYVTTDGITYLDLADGITNIEVIGNKYETNDNS